MPLPGPAKIYTFPSSNRQRSPQSPLVDAKPAAELRSPEVAPPPSVPSGGPEFLHQMIAAAKQLPVNQLETMLRHIAVSLQETQEASLALAGSLNQGSLAVSSKEHEQESVRAARRAALDKAWPEISIAGWDAYGAEAVTRATYERAASFLDTLRPSVPMPDIGADPDGEITFDWYRDADQVFSASIDASGRMSYAGLFGKSKVHGTEWYTGEHLEVVTFNLVRLYRT